ncbi:MAG: Maf family protein [Gammaproteobacteria bacterium]
MPLPGTELPEIILASASPRRAELLQQIGARFQLIPVDIDESLNPGESGIDFVMRLACEKARAGAQQAQLKSLDYPVLGADTIVELEGEILGKPENPAQAREMLGKLSGTSHRVHTAIALVTHGGVPLTALSTSVVEFGELTQADIEHYVDSGEPLDKAGSYAIQGVAAQFVKSLSGSYSGVMGLPLYETAQLLKTCHGSR